MFKIEEAIFDKNYNDLEIDIYSSEEECGINGDSEIIYRFSMLEQECSIRDKDYEDKHIYGTCTNFYVTVKESTYVIKSIDAEFVSDEMTWGPTRHHQPHPLYHTWEDMIPNMKFRNILLDIKDTNNFISHIKYIINKYDIESVL